MTATSRVLAVTALIVGLVAAQARAAATPRLEVRRVALERPVNMLTAAVVRGGVAWIPDWADGLRRVDLATGRDLEPPAVGELGFPPTALGVGRDGSLWLAGGSEHAALWRPGRGVVWTRRGMRPEGVLVARAGRAVGWGWASAAACGVEAELFEIGPDGSCTPLVPFPEDREAAHGRYVFSGTLAGGLAPAPDGGFLLLDPVRGVVLRYDAGARLAGSWRLRDPAWRPPDLAAIPRNADAAHREPFYRWYRAQAVASRPAVLADGTVAVVVGLPRAGGGVAWHLDLFRPEGTPRALGVPLPQLRERRVIVADADGGRLILAAQERDWPMGSPTALVEIRVTWPGEGGGP